MAGKSKGPKLRAVQPDERPCQHQQAFAADDAPFAADLLADVLADDGEITEALWRSDLFKVDGLEGDAPVLVHRSTSNADGQPQIIVGSPHGGPMFVLTVAELAPASTAAFRAHFADIYDRQHADECGMSLDAFREWVRDGGDYCSGGYLATDAKARAALGHGPSNCPHYNDPFRGEVWDPTAGFNPPYEEEPT